MKIIGQYSKYGYEIWSLNETGYFDEQIYTAGNNPAESSSVIDDGLPIETIREYCEQTGKELAAEMGVEFIGCEEIEVTE